MWLHSYLKIIGSLLRGKSRLSLKCSAGQTDKNCMINTTRNHLEGFLRVCGFQRFSADDFLILEYLSLYIQHRMVVKSVDSEARLALNPGSVITGLVHLDKLLNLSAPPSPYLLNGDNTVYSMDLI